MPDEEMITVEIDPAELAVRMCEAFHVMNRPMPDPLEALAVLDEDGRDAWIRAAMAALEYMQDCLPTLPKPPTSH